METNRPLLQCITQKLVRDLSPFGIIDFNYMCVIDLKVRAEVAGASLYNNKIRQPFSFINPPDVLKKQQFVIFSSKRHQKFTSIYRNKLIKDDANIEKFIRAMPGKYLFNIPEDNTRWSKEMTNLMQSYGYQKILGWALPAKNNFPWVGIYTFSLSINEKDAEKIIEQKSVQLETLLNKYQNIFIDNFNTELNPWLNNTKLGNKSIEALRFLSEGMSIDDIASNLFLSKRGVEYHLDVIKEMLKAKNRAHLINRAYETGFLLRNSDGISNKKYQVL